MSYFTERYGPWAVVAGASQGIGEQYSLQLAAKGLNLIMIARGAGELEALAARIRDEYSVEVMTLSCDLANPDLHTILQQACADKEVGLMVYNATYSHIGEFLSDTHSSKLLAIDVNCKGPLTFLDVLLTPMTQRKRGGIILMSSMSGFQGSAMVANYAATKAYNTVLAEGLWEELRHHGVDVLACVAGATKTPNFNRQTPMDKVASVFPMEPADAVSEALQALQKGQGPTRVVGIMNKLVHAVFSRCISRKWAICFFSKATRKLYA